jgi:hypothetical protein
MKVFPHPAKFREVGQGGWIMYKEKQTLIFAQFPQSRTYGF